MSHTEPMLALVDLSLIQAIYWVALILGGGLVLISTLTYHPQGDAGAGLDLGGDATMEAPGEFGGIDVHGHEAALPEHHADSPISLSQWFSLSMLVYTMAMFGAIGVILSNFSDMGGNLILGLALAGGVAVGQTAHQLLRLLRRNSGNTATMPTDYVHRLARVTIPIGPMDTGEVAITVRNGTRYVPARPAHEGMRFGIGDSVRVIAYRAGTAEVIDAADETAD